MHLTDAAVEAICVLGKHLHYLHLGHALSITDRSIRSLARACTRLRYIDLASEFYFLITQGVICLIYSGRLYAVDGYVRFRALVVAEAPSYRTRASP